MDQQATGFDLYVRDQTSDQVTLYSLSLDGTLEGTTLLSGADLDAAEVRIGRDLNGNGVAGASITDQLLDRWSNAQNMGNNGELLRNLYESNKGLVVSRDGIPYPVICAQHPSGKTHGKVLLFCCSATPPATTPSKSLMVFLPLLSLSIATSIAMYPETIGSFTLI